VKTFNSIKQNIKAQKKELRDNFNIAMQDETFKKLRNTLDLDDEYLSKHTSLLEDSCKEILNCKGCKGIEYCKNNLQGFIYLPKVINNNLEFSYEMCKYQEKIAQEEKKRENVYFDHIPTYIKNASIKEIYADDKSRIDIIKSINTYYKNYFGKREKGLYVSGNFGSGKTYIVAALFNELSKKDVASAIVYFPEFLRDLKVGFDDNTYQYKFDYVKKIPLLLLDDIGAENVTAWSRDEILGAILQYRMEESLPTFFTSNLTIDELEEHLSNSKNKVDKLKARRIIERIKFLSEEIKLIGVNRR